MQTAGRRWAAAARRGRLFPRARPLHRYVSPRECFRASFLAEQATLRSFSTSVPTGYAPHLLATRLVPPTLHRRSLVRFATHEAPRSAPASCWSCGQQRTPETRAQTAPLDLFTCARCGRVQPTPPEWADFFAVFRLPRSFRVDVELLQSRHKELQRALHPDIFLQRRQGDADPQVDATERDVAQQASALVNAALDILRTPHLRAKYMLAAHGISLDDEHAETDMQRPLPVDFLHEVMEFREEMEEASEEPERLRALLNINDGKMHAVCEQLQEAFARAEHDAPESLETCRSLTARLQFLHTIRAELVERL